MMKKSKMAARSAALLLITAMAAIGCAQGAAPAPGAPPLPPPPGTTGLPVPTGPGQERVPLPTAPPVPRSMYSARMLPPVYAPGPGYGSFTRAPKQMICYTLPPQGGCRGGGYGGGGYLGGDALLTAGLGVAAAALILH